MKVANLVDSAGRPVALAKQLGTGGEGSVYEVAGQPDAVAKVYHKPPHADHAAKLRAMVGLAGKELCAIAAWPTALLSERPGGPVVGLTMKKVRDFKESHTLYSPAQRKVAFPHADWKFLTHVAANCAIAFNTVHASGVVIGDVNQSNILVNRDGLVNFIDCDSFQVQAGGRTFLCEVGVPLFTPPELIGKSFRGVTRTADHDRFGLAVLLFHLLMMGRHPFSGRYGGPGDMPIDQAIQEHRFAYGRNAAAVQMQPPLHVLPLGALSPQVAGLFERAFDRQAPVAGRPAAAEWYQALSGFKASLRQCPRDPGHQTPAHVTGCVWCDLMRQGAPNFFVSVAFAAAAGARAAPTFVLAAVWARIDAVPRPVLGHSRPVTGSAFAPTAWPAALPSALPSKPPPPAILTTSHAPPDPVLPPARHRKCVLPYSQAQRVAGYVAVALLASFFPCYVLGSAIGRAAGSAVLGRIILAVEFVLLFVAVVWWLVLEWSRRSEQDAENWLYEEERRERRRMARDQLEAWERKLNAAIREAEREYQPVLREWEQRVAVIRREAERRREVAKAASQAVATAETVWAARASALHAEFDRKKAELARLRDAHVDLERRLAVERQQLLARAQEFQRAAFLQQQFIEDASIPDIGPTRKATLASFGIESAFDVNAAEIRAISGFGEKLTRRLLDWRADVEAQFWFNPAVGVPENEKRALEFRYFQLRQPVEAKLLDGERELGEVTGRALAEFSAFKQRMPHLIAAMERAAADLTVIPAAL